MPKCIWNVIVISYANECNDDDKKMTNGHCGQRIQMGQLELMDGWPDGFINEVN